MYIVYPYEKGIILHSSMTIFKIANGLVKPLYACSIFFFIKNIAQVKFYIIVFLKEIICYISCKKLNNMFPVYTK